MSENPFPNPSEYGVNPQNPYGASQPPNYGTPPPQNPYTAPSDSYGYSSGGQPGTAPGYGYAMLGPGAPGYGYNAPGYGYPQRLPLGVAFQQLFDQYKRVVTQPSVETFAAEIPKAAWDITWIQILLLVGITVLISLLSIPILAIANSLAGVNNSTTAVSILAAGIGVGIRIIFQIIFVPAFFFAGAGIQYLLAKAFNGQSTFLAQCYTALLFDVPIALISGAASVLLFFIPFVGSYFALGVSSALSIYSIVLNVFQLMASHRLSGGKATAVVLIPLGVLLLLVLMCVIISVAFSLALFQQFQNR